MLHWRHFAETVLHNFGPSNFVAARYVDLRYQAFVQISGLGLNPPITNSPLIFYGLNAAAYFSFQPQRSS